MASALLAAAACYHQVPVEDGVVPAVGAIVVLKLTDQGRAALGSQVGPEVDVTIIGSTIGVAFAGSFVAAPFLRNAIGVPGIFALTGILALAVVAVVLWVVPDPPPMRHRAPPVPFVAVLRDPELVRLNVGIFALHVVLMALFVVLPASLVRSGLAAGEHWTMYLGAVGTGFVLMLPFVAIRRIARHERAVFLGSVAVMAAGIAVLAASADRLAFLAAGLVIFFAATGSPIAGSGGCDPSQPIDPARAATRIATPQRAGRNGCGKLPGADDTA